MRRPARPERGGQVDDHAPAHGAVDRGRGRARAPRLHAARRVEAGPRRARRHTAARQPRHHADRRAEPPRLHAPLPRPARRAGRGDRACARDGEARRPSRHAGRQALGWDAPPPADRAGARAPAAARPARRADRRTRPPGAPGALVADRRPPERGHDHPHVDALHRGGAAALRHRADHVPGDGGRHRDARRPRPRARRRERARGLRAAGAARRGRGRGGRVGLRTRRTGTSISILGIDGRNGHGFEGERRPANLEDVFVLLTGEEID